MNIFKALFNIGKIEDYATAIYTVVVKSQSVLSLLESNYGDTFGKLKEYLPLVQTALDSVLNGVKFILSLYGTELPSVELSQQNKDDLDQAVLDLKISIEHLNNKK